MSKDKPEIRPSVRETLHSAELQAESASFKTLRISKQIKAVRLEGRKVHVTNDNH